MSGTAKSSAHSLDHLYPPWLDHGALAGVRVNYSVLDAVDDRLGQALEGRSSKTIATQRELLQPVTKLIGGVMLRELTAWRVRGAPTKTTDTRSSRSRAASVRVITHAPPAAVTC